ncbi:MAG: EAL domain-containing protein [Isosphaeraceae bacterium]
MTDRSQIRVLVAEDSPVQAKRLRTVLESAGYHVETASDGAEAIRLFTDGEFDLILSDVMMPNVSGYEFCRQVKATPRGLGTPFVLLTSLGKPLDLIRGLECGADNYIYKPFQSEALLGRIETILANTSARASEGPRPSDEVCFMGHKLSVSASKERILDYLGSTFEDFAQARQREYEAALSREKQLAQAETYRLREELLRKEKESLGRLHAFLQSTLDALAVRIAILDHTGTILAVNAAWRTLGEVDPLAGRSCSVGTNYLEACEQGATERPAEAEPIAAGIREVMRCERPEFSREYAAQTAEGKRWFNIRITRFGDPESVRVVLAHEDITSRKSAEEQLLHEAYHDVLTGLPNRALFTDHLGRAVARAKRNEDYRFAVLFLDLDGFKVVNDSLGHMAGDHLLMGFGRRLEGCVRAGDAVARLGGDEFAVLVNDIHDEGDALRLVDRIQRELEEPFLLGGHEVFSSSSIGIAVSDRRYERPVEILRDADTAMYRAKALGKAHHIVFDQAMHTTVVQRLRLETDLRRALEREEFWVAYQPIVELATEQVSGFEALVRWAHPERGLVSPGEFIPAVEETGLIIPLDLWVIREASRQLCTWHRRFQDIAPLMLSVNLSSKQFAQPNLLERIDRIIDETGIDPTCLKLEVTESVLMGQPESAAEKLHQIKRRGITLSMDDFGTGYSSLSYLHNFPFNILKIDRSFVSRIGPDGENSEIVATIISLAHNLGMKVVAEGVETEEQFTRLRALQCEYGQGFYFSRPMSAEDAEAYVARRLPVSTGASSPVTTFPASARASHVDSADAEFDENWTPEFTGATTPSAQATGNRDGEEAHEEPSVSPSESGLGFEAQSGNEAPSSKIISVR